MRHSLGVRPYLQRQARRFELIRGAFLRQIFFRSKDGAGSLRIVTGADSSHFRSLLALLASVREYEPCAEVSVWDLGLAPAELDELRASFPTFEIRLFEYSKYPSYFEISIEAGSYAWKPVILFEEIADGGPITLWLDAGDLLIGRLTWLRRFTRALGVYSPQSSGSLGQWTHTKTLDYMFASDIDRSLPNFAACIVGVDPNSAKAKALIGEWSMLAQQKECIAPAGSSRLNHRQDQAVLSVLIHKGGLSRDLGSRSLNPRVLNVLIHQDCD